MVRNVLNLSIANLHFQKRSELLNSIVFIIFGIIILVFEREVSITTLYFFLPLFLMILSLTNLYKAFELKNNSIPLWYLKLIFSFALFIIVLGTIAFPIESVYQFATLLGFYLIFNSFSSLLIFKDKKIVDYVLLGIAIFIAFLMIMFVDFIFGPLYLPFISILLLSGIFKIIQIKRI